jgi:DNA-binding transcriptional regulator LsrR (DeoR family)
MVRLRMKPHNINALRASTRILRVSLPMALFAKGFSQSEIARRVGIGRTSVRRLLM